MRRITLILALAALLWLNVAAVLDILGGDETDLSTEIAVVVSSAALAVVWVAVRRRVKNRGER